MARRNTKATVAVGTRITLDMNEKLDVYLDRYDCTASRALTDALNLLFEKEGLNGAGETTSE